MLLQYVIEKAKKERTSFLMDWAVHADSQADDQLRDERALLIGVLEAKVLQYPRALEIDSTRRFF